MATETYQERRGIFHKMRDDAAAVLSHPALETPDHPYIDGLKDMADYATLGVIDPVNGIVYDNASTTFKEGVVLAPVLLRDLKIGEISVASSLCHTWGLDVSHDIGLLKDVTAISTIRREITAPIVSVAPYVNARGTYSVGSAVAHELDHVMRWWRRKRLQKFGEWGTPVGAAEIEISAYRLERQIARAYHPELFEREYKMAARLFGALDFTKPYRPRSADKIKKAVRAVAFINFMLDELGGDVGVCPNDDVVAAMDAQQLLAYD